MTYTEKFEAIVREQLARLEKLKNSEPAPDFAAMDKIIIGTIDGDGIGPIIMESARKVLGKLLEDEIASGKVTIKNLDTSEQQTVDRKNVLEVIKK